MASFRLLILFSATISMVAAMGYIPNDNGPKKARGDWPDKFPDTPKGFSFKCKGRKIGGGPKTATTSAPTVPVQVIQNDIVEGGDVVSSEAPVTSTVHVTTTAIPSSTAKPTTTHAPSTTTLHQILTSSTHKPTQKPTEKPVVTEAPQTATTFWIRTPTPPNKPAEVVPGAGFYSLGPPVFATVGIVGPFAPDAALDPLNAAAGSDDFNIKPVGIPKAPRAVVDPDA